MTVDINAHWVPGEGRAGLEAALTGGSSEDFLQKYSFIVPSDAVATSHRFLRTDISGLPW
jgi:hypothetical protein